MKSHVHARAGRRLRGLPLAAATLFAAPLAGGTAEAAEPATTPTQPETDAPFRLSVGFDSWTEYASPFELGGGTEPGNNHYDPDVTLSARLRAGFDTRLGTPKLHLVGEGDFFAQRFVGAPTDVGTYRVDPELRRGEVFHPFPLGLRKLYLEWRPSFGMLRVGQQTSNWGLGIVAQGGDRDGRLFGDTFRGNSSERVLFATSPLQAFGAAPQSVLGRLTLVLAGDLVYADETAELLDHQFDVADKAYQVVGSLLVRPQEWTTPATTARWDLNGGLYGARRSQTYAEGDQLDVWVLDGAVQFKGDLSAQTDLRFGAEAAYITGNTDRIHTENGPRGVDVRAYGAAVEAEAGSVLGGLPMRLTLLSGLASGDADPDDGQSNRFTFHGDYDVGLILFDQVIPALQRRSTERVDNPLHAKDTPKGYEAFAGRGGLSGADYALLRAAVGPTHGVTFGVQAMGAATTGPALDPFTTFTAGGSPRNAFGGAGEGTFGTELAAALRIALPRLAHDLEPSLRATYAVLLPGEVLEGPRGRLGDVHYIQLKLSFDGVRGGGR